jgi:hypothetical protein
VNRGAAAWALAGACALAPAGAAAQGLRAEVGATAALAEYRDVRRDSLPESLVPGTGIVRTLPDGTVVTCVPGGDCYWYTGGSLQQAHPFTQDVDIVAWPGMRGVSARVHVRGRYGSNDLWPRSRQEIAALAAWMQLERTAFRIRAGRQEHRGGLGTEVFDGAAVLWRQFARWRIEGFVGRSLADALLQPRTGFLLHDADDLAPDEGSMVWGLETRLHLARQLDASLLYQRNVRFDRVGLYAERIALDVSWRLHAARVETSADYDFASGDFNEARLRLQGPVRRDVHVGGEYRHREPFFELWTIWGAFAPVAFDEGRLDVWWEPSGTLRIDAGGAYRNYGETHTGLQTAPIEGDGWRANASASFSPAPWRAQATYGLHWGHGAYRSRFDAWGGRELGRRTTLGVFASATQQFMEFRFGDGRTQGGGLEVGIDTQQIRLLGNVGWYWHDFGGRPGFQDYGQWRASLAVAYRFAAGIDADGMRPRPAGLRPPARDRVPLIREAGHE